MHERFKCARVLPSQQSRAKTVNPFIWSLVSEPSPFLSPSGYSGRANFSTVSLDNGPFTRSGLAAGVQVTQRDYQNKGKSSLTTSSCSRLFAHPQSPLSLFAEKIKARGGGSSNIIYSYHVIESRKWPIQLKETGITAHLNI